MYYVTVLPHGAKTLAGKSVMPLDPDQLHGSALVRVVLPALLVTEFDAWLENSLQPEHVERPTKAIDEYADAEGQWAGCEDLQVVYYLAISDQKIEAIQQFATEFSDSRE